MMRESWIPVQQLTEQHRIRWRRPIGEYFAMRPPRAYEAEPTKVAQPDRRRTLGAWRQARFPSAALRSTFEFAPSKWWVGPESLSKLLPARPCELMTQESHTVGGPALLNTTIHKWARFTCRAAASIVFSGSTTTACAGCKFICTPAGAA